MLGGGGGVQYIATKEGVAQWYVESIEWLTEDQAISRLYDMAPRPPPPLPPPATDRKTEKERQLADGESGRKEVHGWVAESYDREKACSSKNHSILSAEMHGTVDFFHLEIVVNSVLNS